MSTVWRAFAGIDTRTAVRLIRRRQCSLALACLAFVALMTPDARACSCREPSRPKSFPASGATAVPLDAHVWLTEFSAYPELDAEGPVANRVRGPEGILPGRPATGKVPCSLTVGDTVVESDTVRHVVSGLTLERYAPRAALPANSTVRVVCEGNTATRSLAFVTGAARVDAAGPPSLGNLTPKVSATRVPESNCGRPGVSASFSVEQSSGPPLFAIWRSSDGAALDYGAEPAVIVPAGGSALSIGRLSMCSISPSFDFGPPASVLRLGIRAVDLAGRLSPPSEVAIEVPVWRDYEKGELLRIPAAELPRMESRILEQRQAFERGLSMGRAAKASLAASIVAWSATVLAPVVLGVGVVLLTRRRRAQNSVVLAVVISLLGCALLLVAGSAHAFGAWLERETALGRKHDAMSLAEERAIFDAALSSVRSEIGKR